MATMRASVLTTVGPPEVLEFQTSFPAPKRKPGEVLVNVHASSVNPVEWKARKGDMPNFLIVKPQILGGDLAGYVAEADPHSKFKVGDPVFACSDGWAFWVKYGTYAEQATAKESQLVAVPPGFSMEEAACVPLAGMTAWQALPQVPLAGKKVLFHAGAGGVGHLGIQIAKAQGAHVTTTCSTRNVEFVRSLGADVVVDYSKGERFEDAGPFDVVVDCIGGAYEPRSIRAVKRGGHYTSIGNGGWAEQKGAVLGGLLQGYHLVKGQLLSALRLGPRYSFLFMKPDANKGLKQLAELMAAGKLKPHVAKVFPLEQAAASHAMAEKGGFRGKIALRCVPGASKAVE